MLVKECFIHSLVHALFTSAVPAQCGYLEVRREC
jgi:hypothetical protein